MMAASPLPDDILERPMDEIVRAAMSQYADWMEEAVPSAVPAERVSVDDGGIRVLRRPFRRAGHWCVKWAGTARLTKPRLDANGDIHFFADWSLASSEEDREPLEMPQ